MFAQALYKQWEIYYTTLNTNMLMNLMLYTDNYFDNVEDNLRYMD